MSISQLLVENELNLFAKSITTNEIVTSIDIDVTNSLWVGPNSIGQDEGTVSGVAFLSVPTVSAISGATGLSPTQCYNGILACSGGPYTITLPNAVNMLSANSWNNGLAFEIMISNNSDGIVTLANSGDSKFVIFGSTALAASTNRILKCVVVDKTAAATPSIVAY